MITFVKSFLWDETAFIRYSRAMIYGLSVAITQGMIPGLSGTKFWWVAQFLPVLALMLGAGDKNRTPAESKAIAHDLSITEEKKT